MKSNQNQKTVDGIISGDSKTLKNFYKNNLPFITKHIMEYGGTEDDVKDVFQDAFIVVYCKLCNRELRLNATIDAYFQGVCKNIWRNQLRKHQAVLGYQWIVDTKDNQESCIIENIIQQEQQNLYKKHLSRLNVSRRYLLSLFFDGKNIEEVVKLTGYTPGYIRKKKCESKKMLIQRIAQDPLFSELQQSPSKVIWN
ncbi:sigma-70 family RNA polymerase sigma factor [uncultured Aquimarina sp.]|uniref:RNA polymerase sigma factor n=1 Tax=uncultured Aquimarina sp. TaxID=575652 RepID=UPI0026371DE3|nr:sigma-70 family RNA polymerase sigma factor [uncultured Aquimarina sp.]